MKDAAENEWELFRKERSTAITDISELRHRVAEEESRRKTEREEDKDEMETDTPVSAIPAEEKSALESSSMPAPLASPADVEMDVDDGAATKTSADAEKKGESTPMQADDDDAVEY